MMMMNCINTSDIVTIYAQGNMASRAQCAKYTSNGILINGAQVTIPNAPDLLFNPFIYPELDDIGYYWSWNPIHWFFQILSWMKTFYFNSYNETAYHVHLTEVNVAGKDDIRQHHNAIRSCVKKYPDKNIVLFGASRGASMTLVGISTLPEEERSRIKLVVLEAPFDSVPTVLKYRFGEVLGSLCLILLEKIGKYDPSFISPIDAIENFPLDIPVVFITSLGDRIVHHTLTQNLIDKLQNVRGHKKVHHLMLHNTSHTAMSLGKGVDQREYLNFMNSIYLNYFPANDA
jgi:hypothetical protein